MGSDRPCVAGEDKRVLPPETSITSTVGIGPIPNGFGIEVGMNICPAQRETPAARAGPFSMRAPTIAGDARASSIRRDLYRQLHVPEQLSRLDAIVRQVGLVAADV